MAKYRIGLDIGSNSVGWCVTDDNFHIVEKDNKKLWGVLMFEEQQKGNVRRQNRGNRRRTQRRRNRIIYLQDIFKPEISKVDSTFFARLDESFKKDGDRKHHDKYTLFIDKNFNDKHYFKKYPTIYHLQKELMESNEKADIRLVYLAIAHCIKHRGNFLDSRSPDVYNVDINKEEIKERIVDSLTNLKSYVDDEISFDINDCLSDDFISVLKDNFSQTTNDKTKLYDQIFKNDLVSSKTYKNSIFELVKLVLAGREVKFIKYFEDNVDEEKEGLKYKISEEQETQIEYILEDFRDPDLLVDALNKLNEVYQSLFLNSIFKGKVKTLPEAQVKKFDDYKNDLKELKKLIKLNYSEDVYYDIFMCNKDSDNEKHNYVHYTSTYNEYNKNIRSFKEYKKKNTSKCSRDDFIKYLVNKLDLKKENEKNKELFKLVNREGFLVKPKSQNNAVFPYQLKYQIIKKIIENQEKYYDFLNAKDDEGYVNKDKILSLLTFKIPYYFGPLGMYKNNCDELNSEWAWIKKYEGQEAKHIRPWNYKDIVDQKTTQEAFINRMQNRCSYLKNEFCLPKDSIIFQKYMVYQFLNYIRINGDFYFDADKKDEIIKNLFLKNRKVTKKALFEYINVNILNVKKDEDSDIGFVNGEIDDNIPSLSSFYDFIQVYGSIDEVDKNIDNIESIIKDIAILQDKNILEERLRKEYKLNDYQVKKVKGFNYKNFSSLSGKLLNGILPCDKNGEVINKTILSLLKECNSADNQGLSLTRLLTLNSDNHNFQYDFKPSIDNENNNIVTSLNRNDFIDDLYIPVCSKRAIKQACSIIDELKKILELENFDDVSFAVEVTRKPGDKKKTLNRYKEMQKILGEAFSTKKRGSFANDVSKADSYKNFNDLKDKDEGKVRSEKFYYYFMQLGVDMYTGKKIDYDNLDNYDIDHIIPQSLVKNDSIDNKILTEKLFNEGKKKNLYPFFNRITLFEEFGGNVKAKQFWKKLLDNKLISIEKYKSLTRTAGLSDDEIEGFENRQKTTTDQSVKGFIEVLKDFYKVDSLKNIIYSKAANVTSFRAKYDIYKSRIINNYHHAHDAYLNIIIGTILDKIYKKNYLDYKRSGTDDSYQHYLEDKKYSVNPDRMIEMYVKSKQNGNSNDFIGEIKENIYQTKNIFTKRRTYYGSSNVFSKISLLPPKAMSIPIKKYLASEKYGHYDSYNFSSYCLIRWKDKPMYTLEAIPSIYMNDSSSYLKNIYGEDYDNFYIYLDKLKVNTKIKIGNKCFVITGKTNAQFGILNSIEKSFVLENVAKSQKLAKTVHDIYKVLEYFKNNKIKNDSGKEVSLLDAVEYLHNDDKTISKINSLLNGNYILDQNSIKNKGYDSVDNNKSNKNRALCLSMEDINELYGLIIKLYSNDVFRSYGGIYSIIENLSSCDEINNMNIIFKIKIITELLNIFKTNEKGNIDLSFINCSKKTSGVLNIGKNIKLVSGQRIKIIFESDTGMYKKVITLK